MDGATEREQLLRTLLDSYGNVLSPKTGKRLFEELSAPRWVRYNDLEFHARVTEFIDNSVVKPGHERHFPAVSLDSEIDIHSSSTQGFTTSSYYALFGRADAGIEAIFSQDDMTSRQAAEALKDELDENSYKFLVALTATDNDFNVSLTREELKEKLPRSFRGRLQRLASAFYVGGNLVIPRGSKILSYYPLTIRIGRSAEEVIQKIYEAHERGMTLRQARKFSGVSSNTVRAYWIRAGLKPHGVRPRDNEPLERTKKGRSTPVSDDELEDIIKSYELYDGKSNPAAISFGRDRSTIVKIWRSRGLPHMTITDTQRTLIYKGYNEGLSEEATADLAGVCSLTVRRYWHLKKLPTGRNRTGTKYKSESCGLRDPQIKEILDVYKTYNGNPCEAARHLPYTSATIRKYWRLNDLTPNGKEGMSMPKLIRN